ncbi:hypothetical protein HGRIS_013516 [Hohenbuehelia grisea]|uniref:Major facilitator superfamily (MFS) profile domain-containing protein n=1 Tax=Hohenbuehelia grisea TaxID=104357 RepID=A0ABR3IVV7_9AGAR
MAPAAVQHDEASPLLTIDPEAQTARAPPTPLPKGQMAALCSVRLVDPIAFTQIFPYVNEFMSDLNLTQDPSRIGFYSGLVESAFALAQLCSIYQWAKLSDIVGRKPVIIAGIAGLGFATLLFGVSKSLPDVIISRCLSGLFSGNVAVIHSVLGEITDASNQALAFPIYGLFWPLGAIIGPLLGGTFSNPATKYPALFGGKFFHVYPYFLPCAVAACVAFISVFLAYFFLEETLPSKRRRIPNEKRAHQPTYGATNNFTGGTPSDGPVPTRPSYASLSRPVHETGATYAPSRNAPSTLLGRCDDDDARMLFLDAPEYQPREPEQQWSASALLKLPVIRALCLSGCALSFIGTAFDVVFVLFCYSAVESGGLALSASQIGYSLAIAGAVSAGIQLIFLPTLLRTFDIACMYNLCMALWPCAFAALPMLNLIARAGVDPLSDTPHITLLLWMGIALVLTISRVGCLAFSISMILVKEHAPPSALGAANGVTQLAQCLARAIAPAFVSSAFALSLDNDWLGGQAWVVVMIGICIAGCMFNSAITRARREAIAEGRVGASVDGVGMVGRH